MVCGRFTPRQDGVADYVAKLARALGERGVETVIASAAGSEEGAVEVCRGWDRSGARDAARALRRLEADVVHVQWAPSAFSWSPWVGLLPAMLRTPVVTTLHEYAWWAWPARLPGAAFRPVERLRLWDRETMLLAPRSAALVSTNADHASAVQRRLGRSAALLPIGANITPCTLPRQQARRTVAERYGLPAEAPLLAFFGFVHPVKGVRYLLEGLAEVRRTPEGAGTRLVVAGGFESLALPGDEAGDFRTELEEHATRLGVQDAVTWTEHVPDAEVAELLRAADAVVLPLTAGVTTKSGALLAGLESGSCVLATVPDGGGGPELVDGATIVAIEGRRDSAAVARAVLRVLRDPALRERVGRTGQELAASRSWPSIAAAHRDLYAQVAG